MKTINRSKISPYVITQISEKQENKCNKCKSILVKNRFHVDHIKPLFQGGSDFYDNLQILCIDCHSDKNKSEGIGFKYREPNVSIICNRCKKVMYGYTDKQCKTMLEQHMIKHRNEEAEISNDEN